MTKSLNVRKFAGYAAFAAIVNSIVFFIAKGADATMVVNQGGSQKIALPMVLASTLFGLVLAAFITDRLRSDEVPTTIYLIRHGETPMTPERRFSGSSHNDPGLSEDGLAQAAAVAGVIEEIKPDVLISSPMKRAQQTAQAIAQSTHLQIIEDEIWTELSFGHWDGLTTQEVREKFGEEYEAWLSSTAVAPKEGESNCMTNDHVVSNYNNFLARVCIN